MGLKIITKRNWDTKTKGGNYFNIKLIKVNLCLPCLWVIFSLIVRDDFLFHIFICFAFAFSTRESFSFMKCDMHCLTLRKYSLKKSLNCHYYTF